MKQKRSASAARPRRLDASIEAKTPVEPAQPALEDASSGPSFAIADATAPLSWLNAERALYIWTAIVAACVVWQPFLLGFYLDDWDQIVYASTQGTPFSMTRLLFLNSVDPTRPGLMPARFLCSSLFGDHPVLWQGALLLVNCGIAVSIVAAVRALTQWHTTRYDRAIAAAAGLCWLLLPWNEAARFWPTLLPNILMIAVEGFLCVYLIQGWMKNRSRAITGGALYLWTCLCYEAFYFQWIPLVLIGVALWKAKRIALRPVIASSITLLAAQGVAGLWSVYTKIEGYRKVKGVFPNWSQVTRDNLLNLVPTVLRSVSEISAEFALCAAVVIAAWLFVYVRSFSCDSERSAAYASAALAGISLLGGLISIVVFSLGGRIVIAIGPETRSTILFNFWMVIAAAILIAFTMNRLRAVPKAVFALALAALGLCLAAGQVLRAGDWITAWDQQKKILAEAPISELKRTERDAPIVFLNPLDVNGAPIFAAEYDINHAIPWAYPFLRDRRFVVYSPWGGPMRWNGKQLSYEGQPAIETTDSVYLWRPSDVSFWRPPGPFVVNQDLTVRQLP